MYNLLKKHKKYYMINFIFEDEELAHYTFTELLKCMCVQNLSTDCIKILYSYKED